MSETIVVNLSTFPNDIDVNIVETTLSFLQGAGLYRENVFTEDNTFQKDVTIQGDLAVNGVTTIPQISGNTALSGNLTITGNNNITGNLSVSGSTSTDNITFDQTPELDGGVGILRWNDEDGTLDLGLKGGNVTLQIGQEEIIRIVNKTGADLLESQYKVVRIRTVAEGGAQDQRLAVVLAQGDTGDDSFTTLGVVTENIGNNQEGFITTAGNVRGINTTGTLQGETWSDGDVLYLSPTVAGGLTNVRPIAPDHSIRIGFVTYAHQTQGKIYVSIDAGDHLDRLHDVRITNLQNAQVLTYNSLSGVWENADSSGGGVSGDYLPLSGGTLTGPLAIQGSLSAVSTTGVAHNLTGNINLVGTGSNQLNAAYQNTISLNGENGVALNSNSGYVSISGNNNVTIGGGTLNFNSSDFDYASGGADLHRSALGLGTTDSPTFSGVSAATANFNTVSAVEYDVTGTDGIITSTINMKTWVLNNANIINVADRGLPTDLFFKPDGSILYTVTASTINLRRVNAYSLSAAWDLTTGVFFDTLNVNSFDISPQGVYFTPSGDNVFVLGSTGNAVGRYPLSSAWSLSSAPTDPTQTLVLTSITGMEGVTAPRAIYFKPDGLKLFLVDDATNLVFELSLDSPWDLTSSVSLLASRSSVDSIPVGLSFSNDGSRMFILGGASDRIQEFVLPTPWSLADSTLVGATTFTTPDGGPTGVYYNDVDYKCFICGNTTNVREVDIGPNMLMSGINGLIQVGTIEASDGVTASTVTASTITTTNNTNNSTSIQIQGNTNLTWTGGATQRIQGFSGRISFGSGTTEWGRFSGAKFRVGQYDVGGSGDNGTVSFTSPSIGLLTIAGVGGALDLIQLGGAVSIFPAIKRNGNGIDIRDAADTDYTDLRANNITATGKLSSTGPVLFPSYTVTGVPNAADNAGGMIYVSNEVGGATMAFSDGTNWRRVQDRVIISEIP